MQLSQDSRSLGGGQRSRVGRGILGAKAGLPGGARSARRGAAGRPPRPTPPYRRTREAARPRRAAVALRLGPLLPHRPPPPAPRRRGSSGQPTPPPPPPPPPLPPLQPFGRCVTRRFLPTWRPGQVGGDGGQSAATAGANPLSSQGSPALAGPLSRRLVPRPLADGRRAGLPRLPRAGGASEGGGQEGSPGPGEAEFPQARPFGAAPRGAVKTSAALRPHRSWPHSPAPS